MARGLRIGHASAAGDIPAGNPFPSGALSFTVAWDAVPGAAGYVIFGASSSQAAADPALYPFRVIVSGGATTSQLVSGVSAGDKAVRVAAHDGTWLSELSIEVLYTPA